MRAPETSLRRRTLLLVALAAPGAALANAAQSLLPPLPTGQWQRWGSGVLRRFGFRVYRATLWAVGSDPAEPPYALELEYGLSIAGEKLAETSVDEMRRLGMGDEAALRRWGESLRRVFPDVRSGERIVGVHLPDAAVFYHQAGEQRRLLGRIEEADFAHAFFAIWLDPRTSAPEVRAALLQRSAAS